MFACLYRPPVNGNDDQRIPRQARDSRASLKVGDRGDRRETFAQRSANVQDSASSAISALNVDDDLLAVAREFSPRHERHGDDLVSIDISGLGRLIGTPRLIGEELRRDAASRGFHVHVAVARTCSAAILLALARPGLTVVDGGKEREALAPLPIGVLANSQLSRLKSQVSSLRSQVLETSDLRLESLSVLRRWGIRTLGDLSALPSAELASRFGQAAAVWQSLARGEDARPLVPTQPDERFEERLELEWPIEGAEPLSFVLTRLLEPLSARLERRDRGVAVLHVELGLVTREIDARRLQLPSPMRDVRALRTLVLLDLESHPPPAAIDRVAIIVDPTPGRIVQHTLYARAQPAPEQVSTLVARLGALMGQDRLGVPVIVDSHRPGAFAMQPFATDHDDQRIPQQTRDSRASLRVGARKARRGIESPIPTSALGRQSPVSDQRLATNDQRPTTNDQLSQAVRRCRQPVPARVTIGAGRPLRVMTDRRGFAGGSVVAAAGPWRISGEWWEGEDRGQRAEGGERRAEGKGQRAGELGGFNRDEWDVRLTDGAVYRIFRDCDTDGWFIEAIVD